MNKIIDGVKISNEIKGEISNKISKAIDKGYRSPSLKIVLVGGHGPSLIYVNAKLKACEAVSYTHLTLPTKA